MTTKPTKCTPTRKFAHHWGVGRQDGSKYVWGSCRYCEKRRLFRTGWPDNADWAAELKKRLAEELKIRRRERRLVGI